MFKDLPAIAYYPCVDLRDCGDQVRILSNNPQFSAPRPKRAIVNTNTNTNDNHNDVMQNTAATPPQPLPLPPATHTPNPNQHRQVIQIFIHFYDSKKCYQHFSFVLMCMFVKKML